MAYDREEVLKYHIGGKVAVALPKPLKTKDDLCLAYTPGVAHAVKAIAERPDAAWDVTLFNLRRLGSKLAVST